MQVVYRNAIPLEISETPRKTAELGGWEGKGFVSDDFNEPMDEFEEYTKSISQN
ncbi:MAG: DUF2281 domain-containing protein [Clostridiales bacterium]|jgi:hypothetical protein|nr:DUF2281 domain-containing protein [Clostridiales bacterium]